MTADVAEQPQPSTAPVTRRWRVTMADNTTRVIEARGFRVEHDALARAGVLGTGQCVVLMLSPVAYRAEWLRKYGPRDA
jgi:hypothetical protein